MTDEYKSLKQLIIDNPTLPMIFFASDDCNDGDYNLEQAEAIGYIGTILNCKSDELPRDDRIYMDEEDLECDIIDTLWDDYSDLSEEDFDKKVNEWMEKLEPYWEKYIIIEVRDY